MDTHDRAYLHGSAFLQKITFLKSRPFGTLGLGFIEYYQRGIPSGLKINVLYIVILTTQ
jgi:hypothetical protein